jgi:hypothetical protein
VGDGVCALAVHGGAAGLVGTSGLLLLLLLVLSPATAESGFVDILTDVCARQKHLGQKLEFRALFHLLYSCTWNRVLRLMVSCLRLCRLSKSLRCRLGLDLCRTSTALIPCLLHMAFGNGRFAQHLCIAFETGSSDSWGFPFDFLKFRHLCTACLLAVT